ncbi:g7027 [Coccomyxa viridis]|uniref:G7027 protein n=1 Tax=Coccomyxa viridis TaxID=1274662 RepID=A0ABP1G1N0_9CHLO
MSCYVKSRAEKDVNPTDGPAQPSEARAWDGADQSFGRRPSHEHSSGTPVRMAMPGLDEELSSQSHKGVKKRGRGRPVIYQGDPDAPGLDPAQRRLLQRRISNRESARRTRKRHQEHAESLYAKAKSLHRNCNILVAQVDALELKRSQSEALEKEMADVLRMKDEQVQDVHQECQTLAAQVDVLKLKLIQSEALEKRLTEVLQMKDEQMGASKREIEYLESKICGLALQLKEQKMLRLEMHLGMQGSRSAMNSSHMQDPCSEVLVRPGSGSLSQNWDPYALSESAAEQYCDEAWLPILDSLTSQPARQTGLLHARGEACPTHATAFLVRPPCNTASQVNMELPNISGASEGVACPQASLIYMMREVGLLQDIPVGGTTDLRWHRARP